MRNELATSIAQPVEAYVAALNRHDLDEIVGLFTHDGAVMANEAPTASGTAELLAVYAHGLAMMEFDRVLHIDDAYAEGDMAFVRSHTTGSFTLKANGMKIDAVFRELFILTRVDGDWKIRCYMFNTPTAAQPQL